ncbi:Archease [Gracilaria domingensis]|nr:Archease [Gracilaria domingensis]
MSADEAITVTWQQLPQREAWDISKTCEDYAGTEGEVTSRRFSIRKAESPEIKQEGGWEYLDHTADVQIHSWGSDMGEAYGAAVVGMSGYMVELDEIQSNLEADISVQGHDEQSLLFNLMDECLYVFHTEQFVTKRLVVRSLDTFTWEMKVLVQGGKFDASQHSQGTEVKAITYSNMQILKEPRRVQTFVIVDI